jgi:hypothetical protein
MFPDDELVKLRELIDSEFDKEYTRRGLLHHAENASAE